MSMEFLVALALAAAPATADEAVASPDACPVDPATSLLATHQRARAAHLAGDARVLAEDSAESVVSARRGGLDHVTRAQILARFTDYFAQVEYRRWDDLVPPRVELSADGSVGWMAVRIEGELRPRGETGGGAWERFTSSWVATYARAGCGWQMTAISSDVVPVAEESPETLQTQDAAED